MKITVLVLLVFVFIGCGESTGKQYVVKEPVNVDKTTTVSGDAIIVESGDNTDMNVTKNENGTINIDCGEGGCGDITIGTETTDSNNNDNNDSNESE